MSTPSHRHHPVPPSGLVERQVHRWDRIAEALRHGPLRPSESPRRPVITISGAVGSGRLLLAEELARRLNYEIYGRELVEKVAQDLGLNQPMVQGLDERVDSEIRLQLSTWMRGHKIDSQDYIRSLARVMVGLARSGGAIILGRGSSCILHDLTEKTGASLRLEASLEVRVRRLMEWRGLPEKEARHLAQTSEEEQRHFLRHYFKQDISNSECYDLIINTGRLTIEQAAMLVLRCLEAKGHTLESLRGR